MEIAQIFKIILTPNLQLVKESVYANHNEISKEDKRSFFYAENIRGFQTKVPFIKKKNKILYSNSVPTDFNLLYFCKYLLKIYSKNNKKIKLPSKHEALQVSFVTFFVDIFLDIFKKSYANIP